MVLANLCVKELKYRAHKDKSQPRILRIEDDGVKILSHIKDPPIVGSHILGVMMWQSKEHKEHDLGISSLQ